MKEVKILRFLLTNSNDRFQLFSFCDSSEKACAAVIYCRSKSETDRINVKLVIAKTKVAPFKIISLPRLELAEHFC